jgi:hypothetical protein
MKPVAFKGINSYQKVKIKGLLLYQILHRNILYIIKVTY